MERSSSFGSESSAGSAFTSRSGASKMVKDAQKEQALESQNQTLLTALFGALYTLAKEKISDSARIAMLTIGIDFILIVLLFLMPEFPWAADPDLWIFKVFYYIEFHLPIAYTGYTFYLVVFYILVGVLFTSIGICVWVGWCFSNDNFTALWPIKVARVVVSVFVSIFYIASCNIFLTACQCSKHDGVWVHSVWKINCGNTMHLIHMGFSIAAVVSFSTLAMLLVIADHELEPLSRSLLASPTSMAEVRALACKTVITVADILLKEQPHIQTIVFAICCGLIFYYHLRWVPHYTAWINGLRGGLNGIMAWVSLMVCIITHSVHWERDKKGHPHWEEWDTRFTLTMLMAGGVPISFLLGAGLVYLRLFMAWRTGLKFREWVQGINPRRIHTWAEDFDCEVAARSLMRAWVGGDSEEGAVDPVALDLAENVLKAGVLMMPNSPYLHIVYSNFLIEVRHNLTSGWGHLEAAKRAGPNLSYQFSIFTRQQQHKQQSAGGGGAEGEAVDLVSYVEFQKNYKALLVYHKAALVAARGFWRLLMREQVPLEGLSGAFQKIDTMERLADKTYKLVLDRYPKNVKLLRSYGKFLEHVKNDPWGAARYYSEAEKQEELADSAALGGGGDSGAAIITANATGVITSASKAAYTMFGYKKGELEGKNVSVLCAPPFNSRHAGYMRAYATTGVAKALGMTREVVGVHRERYVFPLLLGLSKVSGSGPDSIFMAVLKPVEARTNELRVWLATTGVVVCADAAFLDTLGWGASELVGSNVTTLAGEGAAADLERAVQRCADYDEEQLARGAVTLVTRLKHKYGQDMVVNAKFEMKGTKDQRLLGLVLRTSEQPPLAAAMDPKGHLLWVSASLAQALGHKSHALRGKELGALLPPPWGALHFKWLREMEHAPVKPSPASCRARMPVSLLSSNGSTLPVRMNLAQGSQGIDTYWSATFSRLAPAALLDEKRLRLRVDMNGMVVAAGVGTPATTFNCDPEALVGQRLEGLVDAFANYCADGGEVASALAALLSSSAAQREASWRVAVGTSVAGGAAAAAAEAATQAQAAAHVARASEGGRFLLRMATRKGKPIPAIMTVEVPEEDAEEELTAAGLAPPIGGGSGVLPLVTLWRADMVSAVVELVPGPLVCRADPALSLVMGRPSSSLINHHLYKYLVLPASTTLEELMGIAGQKRGGMKKAHLNRVGPRRTLQGVHVDGRPLHVSFQATLKDGNQSQRLLVLIKLLQPVGAAQRLLADLVAAHAAAEEAGGVLGGGEGSEADSEAALATARATLIAAGAAGEGGPPVPRLDLHKLPMGEGGAITSRRSNAGGDPLATARGVEVEMATGRKARMQLGEDGEQGSGPSPGGSGGGSDDLGGSEGFGGKEGMALSSDGSDEAPAGKGKGKGKPKKHLTEEEQEAKLAAKGAAKAAEWLASGFSFKQSSSKPHKGSRALLLPGAVPEDEEEEEAGALVEVAVSHGAGTKAGTKGDGEEGEGSADGATAITSASAGDSSQVNDFSRGKRLKKLLRLLNSAAARATIIAFRLRMLLLTATVGVLHVVCFGVLIGRLASAQVKLRELQAAGYILDVLHRMCSLAVVMEAAQRGVGFTAADIPGYSTQLLALADSYDDLHQGQYLGFDGLRVMSNPRLQALWHDAGLQVLQFSEGVNGTAPAPTLLQDSLFNLGAMLASAAREVAYATNRGGDLASNRQWSFLLANGPGAAYQGYLTSLNFQVLEGQSLVSSLRLLVLVLLVVEGGLLLLGGAGLVAALMGRVSAHRASLFSVFLAIPQPHLRSLASRSVNIGEEEDEEEDSGAKGAGQHQHGAKDAPSKAGKAGAGEKGAGGRDQGADTSGGGASTAVAAKSKRRVSMVEGGAPEAKSRHSAGRPPAAKPGAASAGNRFQGKSLVMSAGAAYKLAWPYVLYGAIVVAFFASSYVAVAQLDIALVTTKLGQRALGQASRVVYTANRVVLDANTTGRSQWQAQLSSEATLMSTLWERLLYGGDTLPDAAADGAMDGGQGAAFTHVGAVGPFYTDKGCVRTEAATCLPAGDPYYEISRAGMNALANRLVSEARLLAADDPTTITPASSRYTFMWGPARLDLQPSLSYMVDDFVTDGFLALGSQRTNHIVLLLLSCIALGSFVVLLLHPFLGALGKESRRVAELLAQLPPDMDVEALVEDTWAAAMKEREGAEAQLAIMPRSMSLGGSLMAGMRSALGSWGGAPQPWEPNYMTAATATRRSVDGNSPRRSFDLRMTNNSWMGPAPGGQGGPGGPGGGAHATGHRPHSPSAPLPSGTLHHMGTWGSPRGGNSPRASWDAGKPQQQQQQMQRRGASVDLGRPSHLRPAAGQRASLDLARARGSPRGEGAGGSPRQQQQQSPGRRGASLDLPRGAPGGIPASVLQSSLYGGAGGGGGGSAGGAVRRSLDRGAGAAPQRASLDLSRPSRRVVPLDD